MCSSSSGLIVFLIFKILVLIAMPITVFILYRKENRLFDFVSIINILFVAFIIIMRLVGNVCVTNSTISYIKDIDKAKYVSENTDAYYETVYSTEQYTNNESREIYQYSISSDPIKNVILSCSNKSYLKHYGDSIAAITSLIANYTETDTDEIEILDYLESNNLIDCENGFNFEKVFNAIAEMYSLKISQVSSSEIKNYLSNGNNVLVETINKVDENKNFGCEKDYIVIYNEMNDEYSILNPNDKTYSYFCPNNTIGYGSIIEENQNERSFTLAEINSKALRYFVVEVR